MSDLLPIDRLAAFAGPGVVVGSSTGASNLPQAPPLPPGIDPPQPITQPSDAALLPGVGTATIGGGAAPVGGGMIAAPAAPGSESAEITKVYNQVVDLIAKLSARLIQNATAGLAGTAGGGGGLGSAAVVTGPATLSAQELLGGGVVGIGSSTVLGASVVGGGGSVAGGRSSSGFTIVMPGGSMPSVAPTPTLAAAAPVTTAVGAAGAPAAGAQPMAPTVSGGGAVAAAIAQPDLRRVTGTPQPGGLISTILSSAKPTAAPAMSEGGWTVLTDGAGAQIQAHVHGPWSSHPDRIQEGIQRGFIQVHVHEDGAVHLHDVVA